MLAHAVQERMANLEKLRLEVDSRRRTVEGLSGKQACTHAMLAPCARPMRMRLPWRSWIPVHRVVPCGREPALPPHQQQVK